MKKLLLTLLAALGAALLAPAHGAGVQIHMDRFPAERSHNLAALQNGARIFANYCLNCHSANLMRWNRLQQIGLDEKQIRDFLIFGNQKVGDTMGIALNPKDAKAWFGKTPPDLSVIARARTSFDYKGTDYLYTLLRGYYRDASSPTGWNNVAYPNIGMPHILWERQGPREATITKVAHTEDGGKKATVQIVSVYDADGYVKVSTTPVAGHPPESIEFAFKPADAERARQYDSDVADLVAFLAFMTDPGASGRVQIGVWVMMLLGLFTAAAWWMNKAFWRDIK